MTVTLKPHMKVVKPFSLPELFSISLGTFPTMENIFSSEAAIMLDCTYTVGFSYWATQVF